MSGAFQEDPERFLVLGDEDIAMDFGRTERLSSTSFRWA